MSLLFPVGAAVGYIWYETGNKQYYINIYMSVRSTPARTIIEAYLRSSHGIPSICFLGMSPSHRDIERSDLVPIISTIFSFAAPSRK
jgi:hypothetical protein